MSAFWYRFYDSKKNINQLKGNKKAPCMKFEQEH